MSASAAQVERGRRAALTLFRLVVAWAGSLAQGDGPKAGVILPLFGQTYNEYRSAILGFVQAQAGATAVLERFPARSTGSFSTDTQNAIRAIVALGRGAAGETAAAALPFQTAQVPQWYETSLSPLLVDADTSLLTFAQTSGVSTLASGLHAEVRSLIQGDDPLETGASSDGVYHGGPIDVPGIAPRWQMPTWGWWAIGSGLAVGVGFLGYKIAREEGWF